MRAFHHQSCQPITKDTAPLSDQRTYNYLKQIPGWVWVDAQQVQQQFSFKDYYQTISFINAVAWIVQQDNHPPDLQVGYNNYIVTFTIHSLQGLTLNDYTCAAKINQLQ